MALDRKKFREIVFQILFSKEASSLEEEEIVPLFMKQVKVTKSSVKEAIRYAEVIFSYLQQIDALIQENVLEYSWDRVYRVEKNILRLAVFEMVYDPSISPKEALLEGIRLSKKFSSQESVKFVNAVLDAIWKKTPSVCSKLEESKI